MGDPTPAAIAVRDPLSDVTRKERRLLLIVSVIGITLVKTGLVPSKISALGIEFSQTDQKSFLGILALIVGYFLAAFTIYAIADFLEWRLTFEGAFVQFQQMRLERDAESTVGQTRFRRIMRHSRIVPALIKPTSIVRALFEFLLPILVGTYAISILWKAPVPVEEFRNRIPISSARSVFSLDSNAPIDLFWSR